MGQKVNPIIFRIGICKNEWKSKYFERNVEEHSLYSFQSVEIKKYLTQWLLNANLILHDYKMCYTQSSFHIYVSYFATYKIMTNIFKIKRKKICGKFNSNQLKTVLFFKKKPLVFNKYKKFLQSNKFKYDVTTKQNSFLEKFFESLSIFLFKKLKIVLILQKVRKGLTLNLNNFNSLDKIKVKNKLLAFRKYSKDPFFNDMLHLLVVSIRLKYSASLLSNYISSRLMKTKSHTQFLFTLKDILVTLHKTKIAKTKGIKIKIKGRFNGKARSASKIIIIGEIPIQTLDENIDYSESTSYTFNGTFGVKVWIAVICKK